MKWNKRLFIRSGIVLSSVALFSLFSFLYFGAGKIARQVTLLLEDQIETDLSIGSGKVNLFSSFPWVAVSFRDVHISGKSGTHFLDHCDITALLHPARALFGEIHLKGVLLKGGSVHIEKSNDGFNYQVFKKSATGDSSTSELLFMVNKAHLEDIRITYQDIQNGQDYDLLIHSGKISGEFSSSFIRLDTDLKVHSNYIQLQKNRFAQNVPVHSSGEIEINLNHQYYTFNQIALTSGKTTLYLDGSIRDWKTHTAYRLDIRVPDGSFDDILHFLPGKLTAWTKSCRPGGDLTSEIRIRGRSGEHENPHVALSLQQTNGSLFFPQAKEEIREVSYQLAFDNGGARTAQTSSVTLSQFEGKYGGHTLTGHFKVNHLNLPVGNGTISGSFPVRLLNSTTSPVTFISGYAHIKELIIKDLWFDLISPERILNTLKGQVGVDHIILTHQQKQVRLPSGNIWLDSGEVSLDSLEFRFAESSGLLAGTIDQLGKAIEMGNPDLIMYHFDLDAASICLDNFMHKNSSRSASTFHQGMASFVNQKQISMPSGNLSGHIDTFSWGDKRMEDMHFDFASTPHTIRGKANFHSADGTVRTDFDIHCDNQYHLDARVQIDRIQLSEAFNQWNDFGQDVIRAEQIDGLLDGHIWINASIDRNGILLPKTLHSVLGIQIRDGELNRFEMLEQFSKLIHIEDLRNIRFATLRNYIEIKNGQVYIPSMFIQSNAANLTVNGVHGLDQRILYNLKINAGQVLAKQFRKFNPSLEPLPARKEGFINLYYTIFGTTRDFKYESNKTGVQSSFWQSDEIRQQVLDKLRNEFDDVPDWLEPEEWKDIPEYGTPLDESGKEIKYLDVIKGVPRR